MFAEISRNELSVFIEQFKPLVQQMDEAYDHVAAANGFNCKGCRESCCETRFHHHTYLEYYLIQEGMESLSDTERKKVMDRALNVCRKAKALKTADTPHRIMCPANTDGMCRLYAYRPMICRMHGIAHELIRPDGARVEGPGCHMFEQVSPDPLLLRFDRTPFYQQMAQLEKKLRSTFNLHNKIKMTVAQMILGTVDDQ